ncbi:MAG: TadE family protein [Bryobacteraceae bacterium]
MRRHQRGQALVEGTLVMLVFFALLLGVVDFGQVLFAHQSLTERARAAVRWGSLHPEGGPDPVRNLVLYGTTEVSSTTGYLGLIADNVLVNYRTVEADSNDVETLHLEIVNFEAPLFAPWWPGLAHKLMNPRPVSVTAPVVARVASTIP